VSEETPHSATPAVPEVTRGAESEGEEPGVARGIPDDIDIPPENLGGGIDAVASPEDSGEPLPQGVVYKSIWPNLIFIFILGLLCGGLALTQVPPSWLKMLPIELAVPTTATQPTQEENPSEVATQAGDTQVLLNMGFGSGGASPATELAVNRIASASSSITWVTSFPSNPLILQALREFQGSKIIIVGSNTPKKFLEEAMRNRLALIRAPQSLNDYESFLIIDGNYIIDIGRDNTIWETTDTHVVSQFLQWIAPMLEQNLSP
jgi:hypothetical protein